MKRNESFLTGSIPKALIKFAIPLMLANILQLLYSTVDLYIVGNFAETSDASAVATASMMMTAITMAVSGFTTGVTVIIGQFAGGKKERDVAGTVGTAAIFFGIMAVILTVPMLVFNHGLVELLNAPAEAVTQTRQYLFICSAGLIFIVGYNLVGGIMRGMGNSTAPLIFVAVASAVNVIADYVLVKIFSMGAAGAAIATVGSQGVSFIFSLAYLKIRGVGFAFSRREIRLHSEYVKKIFKIGGPISLQEFLVNLSFVLITMVINGKGVSASAAAGFVEKILMIVCMPILAFSSSVAAMSANNIGAGNPIRARKCMWTGISICLVIAVLFNIVTFFKGEVLISIFTDDPLVIENGRLYIKSYGLDQIMLSFVFIMNGYFNSCGHSVFTMVHSLITTFALRVPLTIIFSKIATDTLFYIGCSAPISSFVSIVICAVYLSMLKKRQGPLPSVAEQKIQQTEM